MLFGPWNLNNNSFKLAFAFCEIDIVDYCVPGKNQRGLQYRRNKTRIKPKNLV